SCQTTIESSLFVHYRVIHAPQDVFALPSLPVPNRILCAHFARLKAYSTSVDYLCDLKLRDVNGDGRPEIVIASDTFFSGAIEIYQFESPGVLSRIWTNASWPAGSPFVRIEAADIDNDGAIEIIGETYPWMGACLYVYSFDSGAEKWHSPSFSTGANMNCGLAIGHLKNDAAWKIAMVAGGVCRIFDGQSHAEETSITSAFSHVSVFQDSTLVLVDNACTLSMYQYGNGEYDRFYSRQLTTSAIDGVTVENLNPLVLSLGSGGQLQLFSSDILQSESLNYGAPFGARYRSGFTAGSYSMNAYFLPAPLMLPEPSVTTGTWNQVTWTWVGGAEEYFVECAMDAGFSQQYRNSGWISSNACTFSGFPSSRTYYYRVKARHTSAPVIESQWSEAVSSMQLLPPQPPWHLRVY
ncbi:MAG: VCBS repeat-containing protein, partial [Candidatus Sumerlaeota bacterium]|nr:VCBS repeat-containing protein [Candidatus Sumerlaeota bacterium]